MLDGVGVGRVLVAGRGLLPCARRHREDVIIDVCTVGLVAVIGTRFAKLARYADRAFKQADTSERRLRFPAPAAPVGVPETNPNLEIVFADEETERIFGTSVLGFTAEHLIDRAVDDRERALIREAMAKVAAGRRANAKFRVRSDEGEDRWVAWYGMPAPEWPGPSAGAFVATVDITPLKDAEELLALPATHDQLTGLPNRRLLFDRLSLSVARLTRQVGAVAVLFLDLDGLKLINDQLGHEAGDELLKVVAGRIRSAVRTEDTVVRYGGDEFVVILERILSRDAVARVAAKIIGVVSAPLQLAGERVEVSASIGIALSAGPGDDPDALLREADAAMYLSKQAGRAQFTFFPGPADQGVLARRIVGNRHQLSALPR
jgi:diguanylate cyclase (GGDEF)-like protein/PAS domain S-box-containing protein